MKRNKTPDYKDRTVFGVPLLHNLQRTGHPLPQTIMYAMRYLRRTAHDAVGIFRKPGVRSRIQQLKKMNEANPGMLKIPPLASYDRNLCKYGESQRTKLELNAPARCKPTLCTLNRLKFCRTPCLVLSYNKHSTY